MTERLIIRLASSASQKNHWLIWSDNEGEIIASGLVDNAEQLNLLTEKAQQRSVICLLPSVDVCIKALTINGAFNRQMQQALPYLLEDELASDVELLHFCVIAKQSNLLHVAICDKQKIASWLNWLAAAQINCKQFIPEGLALPVCTDGKWQALQLDQQWIVRENDSQAWGCELSMLDFILERKLEDNLLQKIESYSPVSESKMDQWIQADITLPMELLTRGTVKNKINLLTGEFAPKKESNKQLKKWRMPAILSALLFVLLMVNIYLQILQVEKQTRLVKQQVEAVYKQAFPLHNDLKYTRIKKKIKTMLSSLGGGGQNEFLSMLNDLVPVFADNPQFKPNSFKFDIKKQEMRISATADNFQTFEKFNISLATHFIVEQGALNSSKGSVSGLLTVRKK